MERQAIQFALLEWINYFPLPSRIQTARDLNDGILLWKLLCHIDPDYFGARHLQSPVIKNPEDWLPKWNNLKQIYRELVSYIRDECESNLSLGENAVPDAKAIADWSGEAMWELTKLFKIIVIAAIRSPKANEFLGQIATSPEQMQAVMKSVIEDLTVEDEVASNATSPTVDSHTDRDQVFSQGSGVGELAFEEQLAKIQSERKELFLDKQDLQQEVSELHDRLVRLQDNNQVLQSNLAAAEDRLGTHGAAGKGYGRDADTVIKRLETRLHEAGDVIAEYEVRLEEGKASNQEQEKLIESLQPASRLAVKLQDDLDEIKIERNNLAKKANALDKYKQKLQASQSLETDNRELRLQLEDVQKQLTASEDDRDKILGLEMTIDKYQQMIRHIEQDNHELQVTKEQYAIDKQTLVQRLERKAEQEVRYETQIADLQLDRSGQQLGAIGHQGDDGDLEAELNDTAVTKADLQLQISILRAELRQAKSGGDLGARIIMLDTLLKEDKKKVEALEQKWLDASQREKAIEAQLAVLRRGPILEGHELLFKLREDNSRLEAELAVLAKRLQSTEFELSSKRRKLGAANTDLSLIGKSEAEALAALKAANSAEVDGLRVAHSQLLGHHEQINLELDMQKSLLNKTLIQLNTHRDHLDESQSTEFKKTLDILKAATRDAGHDGTDYEAMKRRITQQEEEIESGNTLLSEQLKATEGHVARLRELESELLLAKESERTAILKAQQEQLDQQKSSQAVELENLYRENALMATAWYELSSRMQQNNVDLQRRTEPRSWLNKQRGLLNGATTSSGVGTAR